MKRSLFIRCAISLAIAALTALSPLTAFAEEGGAWIMEGQTLYRDNVAYTRYDLPVGFFFTSWYQKELYAAPYNNTTGDRRLIVTAVGKGEETVVVSSAAGYFATDDAQSALSAYFSGSGGRFFLSDEYASQGVAFDDKSGLSQAYKSQQLVDVRASRLYRNLYCRVIRANDTYAFYEVTGEFYLVDDSLYYVEFASLPNNAFDADGNLSYRGENVVPMLETDLLTQEKIFRRANEFDYFGELLFDEELRADDRYAQSNRRYGGATMFWSFIFGVSLPLMIVVWTAILLIRRRGEHFKRLLFILFPAIAWLILGTVAFVFVLI